jgi:hypothetical protein
MLLLYPSKDTLRRSNCLFYLKMWTRAEELSYDFGTTNHHKFCPATSHFPKTGLALPNLFNLIRCDRFLLHELFCRSEFSLRFVCRGVLSVLGFMVKTFIPKAPFFYTF